MKTISYLKYIFLALTLTSVTLVASGGEEQSSREYIRNLITTSLMAWETGDERDLISTSHDDLLFAFPGERTGTQGALNVFRYWNENYQNTKVYINWILIDNNKFAVEYQFATTQISSNKRTAMGTVAIGEVKDGKIILLKEYTDGRASRLQKTGELPLEEGEEPFPWPKTDLTYPWSNPE